MAPAAHCATTEHIEKRKMRINNKKTVYSPELYNYLVHFAGFFLFHFASPLLQRKQRKKNGKEEMLVK